MKTFNAKAETVSRVWYIVDAKNKNIGRIATEIARVLRGKHKPEYTPHVDTGDHVIVINASEIAISGNKAEDKFYHRHSGYQGGLKSVSFKRLRETFPERIIEHAVKGMLPKNPLGRAMYRKMKVYAGSEHPHVSQQPTLFEITE